jgi:serine/threonine protein phosphatase PrpC
MDFQIAAAGRSDRGRIRDNNEDAFYLDPSRRLFLVADGLGGHAGGELASGAVVEVTAAAADRIGDWRDPPSDLRDVLTAADNAVRAKAVGPLQNMGTTVVALILRENRYWTVHAGDSRAYLMRAGRLERLTKDHTPEQEDGIGLPAPFRSGMITRAIGIGMETRFDVGEGQTQPGDRFLLCSDGLTDAIPESLIATVLERVSDPDTAAQRLIEAANAAGGPDNVTVIVLTAIPK